MINAPAELRSLRIALGADPTGGFGVGIPVIAGAEVESLFGAARPLGCTGALALFQAGDWLLGAATVPLTAGLETGAHGLYEDILAASRGQHLARIWNYVPDINQTGADGLENYRLFCRGRSLAFEQHYGDGFKSRLPAASAVGSKSAALTVVFAASPVLPRHVENPLQVAAYDYPSAYGPRAPSFARATIVPSAEGATVFISGTAAIRGHATIAPHSTRMQVECMLENLHEISRACALGSKLEHCGSAARHFKIYLRHAADQPMVATLLEERLLVNTDHVSYLQAELCRAPLVVEIEASLFGVTATR